MSHDATEMPQCSLRGYHQHQQSHGNVVKGYSRWTAAKGRNGLEGKGAVNGKALPQRAVAKGQGVKGKRLLGAVFSPP